MLSEVSTNCGECVCRRNFPRHTYLNKSKKIHGQIQNLNCGSVYNIIDTVSGVSTNFGDNICFLSQKWSGASFSKNLKSSSDLKLGKDNGYQGD